LLTFLITLAADAPVVPVNPEQSPELKGFSDGGASLMIAFVLGLAISYGVGKIVVALLRSRHFDELFTPPWKPAFNRQESERWSASIIVSWVGSVTAMIFLIWGYTQYRGYSHPFIEQMVHLCGQAWMLLLTILVALGIAKVVAGAVLSIFKNQTVRRQLELFCPHVPDVDEKKDATQESTSEVVVSEKGMDDFDLSETNLSSVQKSIAQFAEEPVEQSSAEKESHAEAVSEKRKTENTEAFADIIARLVGLLIYLIVFLPVFMIAAEIWSWSDTSNAISSIWGWLIPLVGLAAIILLGWFALTAAVIAVIPASQRRSVMVGTTVLALVILVASYNTIFALIFSVAIIIFAWITRNDLPDALAGWYLKSQSNLSTKTPLGAGKIARVQLLTSDIKTVNGSFRVRNRHILRCYLDGTMITDLRMVPIDDTGNPIASEEQESDGS